MRSTKLGKRCDGLSVFRVWLSKSSGVVKYRFNWNAPIISSIHDPAWIYHAWKCDFWRTTIEALGWGEIFSWFGGGGGTKNGDTTHWLLVVDRFTQWKALGGEFSHDYTWREFSPFTQMYCMQGGGWWAASVTQDRRERWTEYSTIPNTPDGCVNQMRFFPMILQPSMWRSIATQITMELYPRIFFKIRLTMEKKLDIDLSQIGIAPEAVCSRWSKKIPKSKEFAFICWNLINGDYIGFFSWPSVLGGGKIPVSIFWGAPGSYR